MHGIRALMAPEKTAASCEEVATVSKLLTSRLRVRVDGQCPKRYFMFGSYRDRRKWKQKDKETERQRDK